MSNIDYYLSNNYLESITFPDYDKSTRIITNKKLSKYLSEFNREFPSAIYNISSTNINQITIDDYINFLTYLKEDFLKSFFLKETNDDKGVLTKKFYLLLITSSSFRNKLTLFITQQNLFDSNINFDLEYKDTLKKLYVIINVGINNCVKIKLNIINPLDEFKVDIDSLGYYNPCPKSVGKKYLNDIFNLITNFLSIHLKKNIKIHLYDASFIKEIKINDTLYNDIYISLLKCALLEKKNEYCSELSTFLQLNFYKLVAQLFINNEKSVNISSTVEPRMYQLIKDFYIKKFTKNSTIKDVIIMDYENKRYIHELLFKTIIYKAFDTQEYRKLLYDNRHQVKITLRTLNYLLYGESWYQREFKKIFINLKSMNNILKGDNIDSFRNSNIIDILGLYFKCKPSYTSVNNKNRLLKKICKTPISDIINNTNLNNKNIYLLQLFSKYKDYSIKNFAKLFRDLSVGPQNGSNISINQYNEVYLLFMIINNVFDNIYKNRDYIGIYNYNGKNINYSQPSQSSLKSNIIRNIPIPYNENNSYFIP